MKCTREDTRRSSANAWRRSRPGPSPTTTSRNSGSRLAIAAIARPTPVSRSSRSTVSTTVPGTSNGSAARIASGSTPSGTTAVRLAACGTLLHSRSRSISDRQTIRGAAASMARAARVCGQPRKTSAEAPGVRTSRRTRALATARATGACRVWTSMTSNSCEATRRRSRRRGDTAKRRGPATTGNVRMVTPSRCTDRGAAGTLGQDLHLRSAVREPTRQLIHTALQPSGLGQEARSD